MKRIDRRPVRGGFTMVEVLVAAVIVAFSMAAIVSTWYVASNMTISTDDKGIAYNLARQTVEAVRQQGFDNTAEAPAGSPVIHYFDTAQVNQDAAPANARYKVSTTVVSSATVASSSPVQPTTTALRTVTVTVTNNSTGAQLFQVVTYLVKEGL
jgi:prepilin-type N-terminal cleavage/methylation domain-containing protein